MRSAIQSIAKPWNDVTDTTLLKTRHNLCSLIFSEKEEKWNLSIEKVIILEIVGCIMDTASENTINDNHIIEILECDQNMPVINDLKVCIMVLNSKTVSNTQYGLKNDKQLVKRNEIISFNSIMQSLKELNTKRKTYNW